MEISREAWKEIKHILAKYKIPFGVHFEERFPMEHLEVYDKSVWDVEVQINEKLLIRDYYDEWSKKDEQTKTFR